MVFGLGGGGGLTVDINIHPPHDGIANGQVVPIDHPPSWKLNKNVYHNSKKKCIDYKNHNQQLLMQQMQMQQQQQQPMYGQPQQQQMMYGNNGQMMMMPQQPPPPPPQMNMNMNMNMNMFGGGSSQVLYAYSGQCQDVQGMANLILQPGKRYDHNGIKIQFLGRIDMSHAIYEGRPHYDFISLTKEIYPPGTLYQPQTPIPFHFRTDTKPYETYHGRNVSVRYLLRVIIERKFLPPLTKDEEVIVHICKPEPTYNEAIKMEVGIEECLHIEFTYTKRFYHLNDYIQGKIHFLLVRIKIKYMELAVIRRETSGEGVAVAAMASANGNPVGVGGGSGGSVVTETQTLTRFEIMDGAPVKGEVIPVKLFLGGIAADLTPTFDAGLNRFTVKYYLNLVLVDEEDRRYFKQQEIILWRKDIG
mmetsp:Transcript_6932/g.10561  ORF Transcript_6932/g.10561 Transcript_6932/m.10561 type:complete len:417 (-) Transcript_6932:338-1588(-)